MNDDPDFDGASLLIVGSHLLAAGAERPALGLLLGREQAGAGVVKTWFIGTRVARAPERALSDVRFEGGAPPLRALAQRIEAGDFRTWFGELKADADAGRVYPVRPSSRVERTPPSATAGSAPSRLSAGSSDAATPPELGAMHRRHFPAASETPVVRARTTHRCR